MCFCSNTLSHSAKQNEQHKERCLWVRLCGISNWKRFYRRFRIVEQYYAPRSVSRYCSNLRNDRLVVHSFVNLYIVPINIATQKKSNFKNIFGRKFSFSALLFHFSLQFYGQMGLIISSTIYITIKYSKSYRKPYIQCKKIIFFHKFCNHCCNFAT